MPSLGWRRRRRLRSGLDVSCKSKLRTVLRLGENCYPRVMPNRSAIRPRRARPRRPAKRRSTRILAAGEGWSVREYVCRGRAGRSRVRGAAQRIQRLRRGRRKLHLSLGCRSARSSIPARCCSETAAGASNAATSTGAATAAFRLGVSDDAVRRDRRGRGVVEPLCFSAPSLPPSPKALPVVALMEALSLRTPALRREELVLGLIERVVAAMADQKPIAAAPDRGARNSRRVVESDPSGRSPTPPVRSGCMTSRRARG